MSRVVPWRIHDLPTALMAKPGGHVLGMRTGGSSDCGYAGFCCESGEALCIAARSRKPARYGG